MTGLLYVALGGFWGSILRFALSVKLNRHPIGTWIANVSGALLFALLLRLYAAYAISYELWLFAGVGFSGSYTTFSTFSNEVLEFMIEKQFKRAVVYAGGSFITAVLIVGSVLII